jgi:two-component system response regulator (stage 0 sporulation protein F)
MGYKILIVDDQTGVRTLLCEAFLEEGYDAEMAPNGYEAVQKVKAGAPDIILMDMKMPGMNGIEALQEIKKINDSIPVIIMTAYGELEVVAEAMKLGISEYIAKPFDIFELRRMVARIVGRDKESQGA